MASTNLNPAVNATFNVSVTLSGTSGFSCWGQALRWDQSRLELLGQSTGSFTTFVPDSRDLATINSLGEVRPGGYYEVAGKPPTYPDNAGGSGTVAVFTFKRIASGTTQLSSPIKDTGHEFGWYLINVAGTERTLATSPIVLVLGDPGGVTLPTVTIATPDNAASEPGPNVGTVTITRAGGSGGTADALSVVVAVGGSATSGDFAAITSPVTIAAGQSSATVTVTPVDDASLNPARRSP